jgi:hypothetical protein
VTRHLVLAAMCVYIGWRVAVAFAHATLALHRAPWPHPSRHTRTTPEPCRLRVVRDARVYDWADDEPTRVRTNSGGTASVREEQA